MKQTQPRQDAGRPYSVRASITLWMALAAVIWGTLGLAVTYASHWGNDPLQAEARRLSKIAPAAGGDTATPRQ